MRNILLLTILLLFGTYYTIAQTNNKLAPQNVNSKGVILDGYDAVAYIKNQQATKGIAANAVVYNGATYLFATVAHKELFKKNPSAYAPAYGGWCAYAMGNSNELVEIDPETFKVIDGRLYVFYNKYFTNTLKLWNKNEVSLKTKADKNWQKRMGM